MAAVADNIAAIVATVELAILSNLVTVVTETLPEMETALKGPGFEAFQDERKVKDHGRLFKRDRPT